jgi:hypothetical protein
MNCIQDILDSAQLTEATKLILIADYLQRLANDDYNIVQDFAEFMVESEKNNF